MSKKEKLDPRIERLLELILEALRERARKQYVSTKTR